ncbi:hypothetical protein BT63DRAFT_439069 [Microthyrium microscopicum]|uniref:DUF4604 domain-containing protein n=1 Tax=Microthyrium microscopicum TaxID=703497 RepID=A0A6A6UG87_9PEZI|nr:hypothetical protein BT63DRAFT_439069 [Microthyrium microscopicum]
MSFKSKNLQFEASEPAFLRRLRGEARGDVDAPGYEADRHINPTALPKKPKRLENDEDDAPAYVLEGSDATLSKADIETLTGKKSEGDVDGSKGDAEKEGKPDVSADGIEKHVQKVAGVGVFSKKRKAIRVGDAEEEEEEEEEEDAKKITTKATPKKSKKKAKTKNLSFADDEDK